MTDITYTSEKVLPYVYQCVHKTTNKFYIGSRTAKSQKLPSHLDFPEYKTSSKEVEPHFEEYEWIILAEFFDGGDAYDHEQELIFNNWADPLLVNGCCHHLNKSRFSNAGKHHSSEHIAKMSAAISASKKGKSRKPFSAETKAKMSAAKRGKPRKPFSIEHRAKISEAGKGRVVSDETRAKLCAAQKGKTLSAETKAKISASMKHKY